jgi:hypothetical protein
LNELMKRCKSCGKGSPEASRFCDECGAQLADAARQENGSAGIHETNPPDAAIPSFRGSHVTSVGVPPIIEAPVMEGTDAEAARDAQRRGSHSRLVIERGESANTEFYLTGEESNIGRWDADNGIFPDVDLDAHDPDAKVSRRHARIVHRNNIYMIEDLGSTNGTFLNRGRRLLPGSPQVLNDGDEIIVGKTFLRFHIN